MALKGIRYTSETSYLLEEPIEVNYRVAGYGDWLEQSIPEHIRKQALLIRPQKEELDILPVLQTMWDSPNGLTGLDLECSGEKENDGLDPLSETSKVILGQFGTEDLIWVVQPELLRFLRAILQSTKLLHINQNLTFDFKWLLKKYGIHLVRIYCTMLAEQVLRAGRDGFGVSLLDLARHHPPCRLISKAVREEFIHHSGVFTEEQLYYAARDIALLFPIFRSQNQELLDYDLLQVAQDEFNCIPATAEMELVGLNLDTEVLDLALTHWNSETARLEKEIMDVFNEELKKQGISRQVGSDLVASLFSDEEDEETGDDYYETFNLDASEQKLAALQRIGLTLPDVKRETLKKISHKIAGLMIDRSIAQKIVSTYGDRLKNMRHPSDNRLHPRFKQLGMGEDGFRGGGRDLKATIATGRFSSDFQNLPRPQNLYTRVSDDFELELVESTFAARLAELEKAA